MYKLLLLFVSLPLSFVANAALSEGELEQLATKFVEAKNARQQPDTTIQDIDAFINLIADEFVDEHVKFNVTITEKSALREGLIAKMNDKIYYSSIVINEMMTGSNVAIIKMTESGKVKPNHLDKDITYSSVNIVTLEFNDAKLITHIRRHHGWCVYNKTLLALPSVAGTLTRGLTHFVRILAHALAPQSLAL